MSSLYKPVSVDMKRKLSYSTASLMDFTFLTGSIFTGRMANEDGEKKKSSLEDVNQTFLLLLVKIRHLRDSCAETRVLEKIRTSNTEMNLTFILLSFLNEFTKRKISGQYSTE